MYGLEYPVIIRISLSSALVKYVCNYIIIPYPRERGLTMECRPTPHFGLNFLLLKV